MFCVSTSALVYAWLTFYIKHEYDQQPPPSLHLVLQMKSENGVPGQRRDIKGSAVCGGASEGLLPSHRNRCLHRPAARLLVFESLDRLIQCRGHIGQGSPYFDSYTPYIIRAVQQRCYCRSVTRRNIMRQVLIICKQFMLPLCWAMFKSGEGGLFSLVAAICAVNTITPNSP